MTPKCILFSELLSMGLYILLLTVQTHLSSRCLGSQEVKGFVAVRSMPQVSSITALLVITFIYGTSGTGRFGKGREGQIRVGNLVDFGDKLI